MWAGDLRDRNSPQAAASLKLAASVIITGYLRVYGFTVSSTNAGSQFVQMFDASTVPADTAIPILFLPVSASNQVSAYYGPMGRIFQRGIVLCNSSTAGTKTIGAADCLFDIDYDWLPIPGDLGA